MKPNPRSGCTNPSISISIDVNGSLQSWLSDEDIIVNAASPENLIPILSGSSEFGKTFLLRDLITGNVYFDKL